MAGRGLNSFLPLATLSKARREPLYKERRLVQRVWSLAQNPGTQAHSFAPTWAGDIIAYEDHGISVSGLRFMLYAIGLATKYIGG